MASKEALREKTAMELIAKQRAAEEAEERHLAQERRLLSEVDRERMTTRQASTDLAKEQKARAGEAESARAALDAAHKTLQDEEAAHRNAAASWAHQRHEAQVELATLRERAAGAEQRATDLASQVHRQHEQFEREISQMRGSQVTAAAVVSQHRTRREVVKRPPTKSAKRAG
jgi:hypothetical protein